MVGPSGHAQIDMQDPPVGKAGTTSLSSEPLKQIFQTTVALAGEYFARNLT